MGFKKEEKCGGHAWPAGAQHAEKLQDLQLPRTLTELEDASLT